MRQAIIRCCYALLAFCGTGSPALAQASRDDLVIHVGMIVPLTGHSGYFGRVVRNGMLIAFKESKLEGIRFALDIQDDAADPEVAKTITRRFISEGKSVILGPMDSHTAYPCAAEAKQAGIAMISPAATASYLTHPVNPWFFRAISSDAVRAKELVDWIREERSNDIAFVLHERKKDGATGGSPLYGESLGSDVEKLLIQYRLPYAISTYHRGELGDRELARIYQQAAKSRCATIIMLGSSPDTQVVAEYFKDCGINQPIYLVSPGKDMFSRSRMAKGVFAVTDTFVENAHPADLIAFRKKYMAQYPDEPDPIDQLATFAYDAANILIDSCTRMLKTNSRDELADITKIRRAIAEALRCTPNDRVGLMSNCGFTDRNELNIRPQRQMLSNGIWREHTRPAAQQPDESVVPREATVPQVDALFMYISMFLCVILLLLPVTLWWRFRTVRTIESTAIGAHAERSIPEAGKFFSGGEDFSALNAMLARLREVRPSATAAAPAAGTSPNPPGK